MAVEHTAIALNTVHSTPIVSVGAGDAQRIVISLYVSSSEPGFISLTSGANFVVKDLPIADVYAFSGKILVNPGENLEIRGLDSDTGLIWEDMTEEQWNAMTEEDWDNFGVAGIDLSAVYAVHSNI